MQYCILKWVTSNEKPISARLEVLCVLRNFSTITHGDKQIPSNATVERLYKLMLFGQAPARATEKQNKLELLRHVLIAKSFEVILVCVTGYERASRLNLNETCQHSGKV